MTGRAYFQNADGLWVPEPFRFGDASIARLGTCRSELARVAHRALMLSYFDFSIICGHRNQTDQEEAFRTGHSEKHWPDGNHNKLPSDALDFAAYPNPYGVKPKEVARYYVIAGAFFAASVLEGVPIVWGGDWDSDRDMLDQKLNDLGHIELMSL